MGVIVGAGTLVTGFPNAVSANWGASSNTQRFYVLGSTSAFMTIAKPTATLSVTVYSPGPSHGVAPSAGCSDAGKVAVAITVTACGGCGGGSGASGEWYISGYSYSKESAAPGQESFSMMRYVSSTVTPAVVIRGVAEGSWTGGAGVAGSADGTADSGSVSAGGIGRSDAMTVGTVSSVGGGSGSLGSTGQASVSVPYTPIYC